MDQKVREFIHDFTNKLTMMDLKIRKIKTEMGESAHIDQLEKLNKDSMAMLKNFRSDYFNLKE